MAESISDPDREDDAAWLEVLAGRPVESMDETSRRQAESLRTALQRRAARIDAAIPVPDEAAFERLLFRLRREGLDGGSAGSAPARPLRTAPVWGLAASLVLASVVVLQMTSTLPGSEPDGAEHLIERGGAHDIPAKATVQLVDDPQARSDELLALLRRAGADPKVKKGRSKAEVVIEVEATDAVRDALGSDEVRIFPDVQNGQITIVLAPSKKAATGR